MKPVNRRHGLYCCWVLTASLSFMFLINVSEGQPQNYFKGSAMTQLPSKALPRIGRRSGADSGPGFINPEPERIFTTLPSEEMSEDSFPPLLVNNLENLGADNAITDQASSNGNYAGAAFVDGERYVSPFRFNRLVDDSSAAAAGVKLAPKFRFKDRGMLYVWKSLGRRESETAGRGRGSSRIGAGGGGFRQDQPTGIIQQFR